MVKKLEGKPYLIDQLRNTQIDRNDHKQSDADDGSVRSVFEIV